MIDTDCLYRVADRIHFAHTGLVAERSSELPAMHSHQFCSFHGRQDSCCLIHLTSAVERHPWGRRTKCHNNRTWSVVTVDRFMNDNGVEWRENKNPDLPKKSWSDDFEVFVNV